MEQSQNMVLNLLLVLIFLVNRGIIYVGESKNKFYGVRKYG